MRRTGRSLRVLLAALSLVLALAACGGDDDSSPGSSSTTTTEAGGDDATTTTADDTTTTTAGTEDTTTTAAPLTEVAVTVNDEPVELDQVCAGADGAVVTIDATGRRVILVQEEGLALRIGQGEDFAETADVSTVPLDGGGMRYSGTISFHDEDVTVVMDVPPNLELQPC